MRHAKSHDESQTEACIIRMRRRGLEDAFNTFNEPIRKKKKRGGERKIFDAEMWKPELKRKGEKKERAMRATCLIEKQLFLQSRYRRIGDRSYRSFRWRRDFGNYGISPCNAINDPRNSLATVAEIEENKLYIFSNRITFKQKCSIT